MGRCSSSTYHALLIAVFMCVVSRGLAMSYQELASDENNDATIAVGGLGVDGGNLVLDFLEGKTLCG
jgi:hypothetical protein